MCKFSGICLKILENSKLTIPSSKKKLTEILIFLLLGYFFSVLKKKLTSFGKSMPSNVIKMWILIIIVFGTRESTAGWCIE